ncbi:MAG TPA: two-component system response regulator [Oceanospirillales bacterium]|nr:two-component system response regulator [Oleispira sp.]HCM04399.1 two-component system response regulator [Oceanospirillales bacterium]|tara:strand:- start:222 stop:764 length:543 start_codon:yes stop_codon:yes gene_type:complete
MPTPTHSKRILIVDDEEHFVQVLSRSLTRLGYMTTVAMTSEQAIEAAKQDVFDWISLDLRLGKDSGLDLISQLLSFSPNARIVILTGFASIPTAVEAIKQGAFNYLHKPATVKELLRAFEDNTEEEVTIEASPMSVERLEWEHIQRILHENEGNVSSTARALGMHRRTLQRKLQKHPTRN